MEHLSQRGIGCGIHYPKPLHLQGAYKFLGKGLGNFPVAENCANHHLSLPMFPELTNEQIDYVSDEVKIGLYSDRKKTRKVWSDKQVGYERSNP